MAKPARENKPYCSEVELIEFKRLREQGRVTIFRTSLCIVCKCEVPKGKAWCSLECANSKVRSKA